MTTFNKDQARRTFIKNSALASAGALMFPSIITSCSSSEESADFIFQGGSVLTMDPTNPDAQALAVQNGRIVAVGSRDQVNACNGKTTQLIDLQGRTLMPGMIVPHAHSYAVVKDDFVNIRPTAVDSCVEVMGRV